MKRRIIALLLNFFLLPFGYFYLKRADRFWFFTFIDIPLSVILSLLMFGTFQFFGAEAALVLLFLYISVWWIVVLYDTFQISKESISSASKIFRLPHAFWFIPAYFVFVLALIIPTEYVRNKILQANNIPSGSMEPSLQRVDYVFTTQLFSTEDLVRGDIVAFQPSGESEKTFIKRIVGIPGDNVEVSNEMYFQKGKAPILVSRVLINGKPLEWTIPKKSLESFEPDMEMRSDATLFLETNEGKEYYIIETNESSLPSETSLTLQDDEYFMMGDNRDDSKDSRYIGPVRTQQIQKKYLFTYFSLNKHYHENGDPTDPGCNESKSPKCILRELKLTMGADIRFEKIGSVSP